MGGGLLWQKEYFFNVKGSMNPDVIPARFGLLCSIYTITYTLIILSILLQFSVQFIQRSQQSRDVCLQVCSAPIGFFLDYLTPFRILLKDQLNPCR